MMGPELHAFSDLADLCCEFNGNHLADRLRGECTIMRICGMTIVRKRWDMSFRGYPDASK
jgi:hypothetical protein